jgi:hypothetical protein
VKNVFGPFGPTKSKGPYRLLLAATWNLTAVVAGVVAMNESVVHLGEAPPAGFASLSEETNVPDEAKPGLMYVMKFRSRPPTVVSADQLVPLVDDVTNWPFGYGLESENPIVAQLHVKAT